MPAMSDAPLRGYKGRHEWFWEPNDDAHVYPVQHLVDMYHNSVGHNSTLILGLTPDPSGLLPQADADTLAAFGNKIKELYATPIAAASGNKNTKDIEVPKHKQIQRIVIQEDITKGQRVRSFQVSGFQNGKWKTLITGSSIGHKFIATLPQAALYKKIRLQIKESVAPPFIKAFTLY